MLAGDGERVRAQRALLRQQRAAGRIQLAARGLLEIRARARQIATERASTSARLARAVSEAQKERVSLRQATSELTRAAGEALVSAPAQTTQLADDGDATTTSVATHEDAMLTQLIYQLLLDDLGNAPRAPTTAGMVAAPPDLTPSGERLSSPPREAAPLPFTYRGGAAARACL